PQDRARVARERLPFLVVDPGCSQQHTVPNEEDTTVILTKKALPRRTFLRGAGAALALPLLDAMIPSMTALAATPASPVRRLGFIYVPMGSNLSQWTPASTGRIAELSPTLGILSPFLDQLTVISNLENKNGYSTGNHA